MYGVIAMALMKGEHVLSRWDGDAGQDKTARLGNSSS